MPARSEYIAAACEIALDRRHRSDESMLAEMQQRFDHDTPAGKAAAEYWIAWAISTKELAGEHVVRQILGNQQRLTGARR